MSKELFRKSFWKENIDKPVIAINVSDIDEFIDTYLNLEKNLPEDKEGIYENYEYRLRLLTGLASSNLTGQDGRTAKSLIKNIFIRNFTIPVWSISQTRYAVSQVI